MFDFIQDVKDGVLAVGRHKLNTLSQAWQDLRQTNEIQAKLNKQLQQSFKYERELDKKKQLQLDLDDFENIKLRNQKNKRLSEAQTQIELEAARFQREQKAKQLENQIEQLKQKAYWDKLKTSQKLNPSLITNSKLLFKDAKDLTLQTGKQLLNYGFQTTQSALGGTLKAIKGISKIGSGSNNVGQGMSSIAQGNIGTGIGQLASGTWQGISGGFGTLGSGAQLAMAAVPIAVMAYLVKSGRQSQMYQLYKKNKRQGQSFKDFVREQFEKGGQYVTKGSIKFAKGAGKLAKQGTIAALNPNKVSAMTRFGKGIFDMIKKSQPNSEQIKKKQQPLSNMEQQVQPIQPTQNQPKKYRKFKRISRTRKPGPTLLVDQKNANTPRNITVINHKGSNAGQEMINKWQKS